VSGALESGQDTSMADGGVDDQPDVWVAFWRGLHRKLSTRDADTANEVAMVVASHLSAGGSDVLKDVSHLGSTDRQFDRGVRALTEAFPCHSIFDVVRASGLVEELARQAKRIGTEAPKRGLARLRWTFREARSEQRPPRDDT
jgi:hypothetical protein